MPTGRVDNTNDSVYSTPEADLVDPGAQAPVVDNPWSVKGRIGVKAYNTRMLWALALMCVGLAPAVVIGTQGEHLVKSMNQLAFLGGLAVCMFLFVFSVVVILASGIKRLHDLGWSGWFVLLGFVPYVGLLFKAYYAFTPGKAQANRYGVSREPTGAQNIAGPIGIVLMVLLYLALAANSVTSLLGMLS